MKLTGVEKKIQWARKVKTNMKSSSENVDSSLFKS